MKKIGVCGLALGVVAALLAASSAAQAHTFGAAGAGFAAGLIHPFGGIDHLLAMLAIGFWAAQQGGRSRWVLPGAFLAAMASGAALALAGVALPAVEAGVAASVLVLGLLVAAAARPSLAMAATLTALFAVLHGHAHGGELPMAASPWLYGLGFVVATAALVGLGTAVAGASRVAGRAWVARGAGAGVAAAGLALLVLAM